MNGKDTTGRDVEARIIRLKLVDGTLVNGQINIKRDKGYDRLSDLITNNSEPFLVMYNVTAHPGHIDNPIHYKTLFINKIHIIWAEPDEEQR
ncbi:MAG: hypothetical protein H8D87_17755 [Deltaproteobacteria bacterium]|uniref:DUF6812 domain-containing protein n=1 Tax=Desulfobacula sp. TaxID=2593537 RepID=UPI0019CBB91B|nr:hypothetical protein [Candidatus Desulfobacula maris]MBL6994668.1 hypothetical protein [Desulfobacula sp.]